MSFQDVMPALLPIENVWSNTPGDRGGETVYGISIVSNPKSPVWPFVRQFQAAKIPLQEWIRSAPFMAAVFSTYKANYWDPCQLDYFPPNLQQAAFGCAVNEGIEKMAKLLQIALIRVGQTVAQDGQIGPMTLKAINAAPAGWLEDAFKLARAEDYLEIANRDPKEQAQFLRGWGNRLKQGL